MGEIALEIVDNVAIVTLNALERRNALTVEMAQQLMAVLDEVDDDESLGALVLSGGPYFCAGAVRSMLSGAGADPAADVNFRAIDALYRSFVRLGAIGVPTIAAVRGPAVGAGLNLALATDLRIVASDARLLSGFGRIGIHPGGGHVLLLHRLGGREAAAALAVFGQEIDGEAAVRLGLAWAALPDAEVDAEALKMARTVAADPQLARRTIASFRLETEQGGVRWPVALELERGAQMWSLRRSHDLDAPASSR